MTGNSQVLFVIEHFQSSGPSTKAHRASAFYSRMLPKTGFRSWATCGGIIQTAKQKGRPDNPSGLN
jgi:hypothetical protein